MNDDHPHQNPLHRQTARWILAGGRVERFLRDEYDDDQVDSVDVEATCRALHARVLTPDGAGFPACVVERLDTVGPWFVRGTLPQQPRLAVVGTRAVDHEGVRLCKRLLFDVAAAGVAIVSGGAIGVDTLAHQAALAAGASTVAFLPSAFDRPSPRRNAALFGRIVAEGGALVSEYPPGVGSHKFHFHRRNHLIAAYADAVLVVRAKAAGGTMITARAARALGTPLLAVPGSPEDVTAAGCNRLLRDGARCVTTAAEILSDLDVDSRGQQALLRPERTASPAGAAILRALAEQPAATDELAGRTGRTVAELLVALTQLELSGAIAQHSGRWRLVRG